MTGHALGARAFEVPRLVQAYPNKQDLVKAIKGRLRSSSGKKKLSRLKRLILREKTDKAVEAAEANLLAAQAAARKAESAHVSVSQSLQVRPDLQRLF